uniref:Uncharacterized protein n=1 Tax=Bostrychia simpliciuscula TaxID=324754 RepID=A0A1Z1M7X6_9FLOR|nr:hypothetical protein [Bostrychia simpliciuscula]ARW62069.1 hypothetical protein [Bostrychia simpliciuscula]
MIVIFFLYCNKYFHSPKTLLHKIKSYLKIYTIFIILICLPYLNCNILIFYFHELLIFFLYILLYPINLLEVLQKTYILTLYISILYYKIGIKNSFNNNKGIYFTSFLSFLSIYKKQIKIYIKYINYFFPKYLQKVFYLNILNFILLKTLFITTQNEKIFNFFINFLKKLNYLKYINYNKYINVLIFSFQFIQKIIYNFIDLSISIKIKYNSNHVNNLTMSFKVGIKFLITYSLNLVDNITYITSILWTRKLSSKNFNVL